MELVENAENLPSLRAVAELIEPEMAAELDVAAANGLLVVHVVCPSAWPTQVFPWQDKEAEKEISVCPGVNVLYKVGPSAKVVVGAARIRSRPVGRRWTK